MRWLPAIGLVIYVGAHAAAHAVDDLDVCRTRGDCGPGESCTTADECAPGLFCTNEICCFEPTCGGGEPRCLSNYCYNDSTEVIAGILSRCKPPARCSTIERTCRKRSSEPPCCTAFRTRIGHCQNAVLPTPIPTPTISMSDESECACSAGVAGLCVCVITTEVLELGCVPRVDHPIDNCCMPTACCNPRRYRPCIITCPGDCNGNGEVFINEALTAVQVAIGGRPVAACRYADTNRNGVVTIPELVKTINAALDGCP